MTIQKRILIATIIGAAAIGATSCAQKGETANYVPEPGNRVEVVLPGQVQSITPVIETDDHMPNIVKADSASYYGNTASMTVPVRISDYFNYAYADAEATHYSFRVGDVMHGYFHAYGERAEFKELFDYLVKNGSEAVVNVTVTTSAKHRSNAIWSIVGWEKA